MHNLTIGRLKINDKCFRVDNKMIVVNPNNKDAMTLIENMKPYYKIHIVLTLWKRWDPDITYSMMLILDEAKTKKAKVYIHIPKMCKDLIKIIDQDLEDYDNYKIIIEGDSATNIAIHAESFCDIYVKEVQTLSIIIYEHTVEVLLHLYTNVAGCEGVWIHTLNISSIPKNEYEHEGIFSSVYRKEYPELFKEEMIKDFKKVTPRALLKAFKDDEDIWDYIMTQNSWEASVKVKDENGHEYTGTFDDQMKDIAKDIMEGINNDNKKDE